MDHKRNYFLNIDGNFRRTNPLGDGYQLREEILPYNADFDAENEGIVSKNVYN